MQSGLMTRAQARSISEEIQGFVNKLVRQGIEAHKEDLEKDLKIVHMTLVFSSEDQY